MKQKQIGIWVLCVCIVLCIVCGNGNTVFAQNVNTLVDTNEDADAEAETDAEVATDSDASPNESLSGTGQSGEEQPDAEQPAVAGSVHLIHVNPLYEDFYSEQAQNAYWADGFGTVSDNASIYATENYLSYAQTVSNIRQAMVRRETAVTVNMQMEGIFDNAEFQRFMDAVFAETGVSVEGDYLMLHYRRSSCGGSYITSGGLYQYTLNFTFEYYTTAEQENEVTAKVTQILQELNLEGLSEYEQIKKIYDYMTSNISYNYEAAAVLEIEDWDTMYAAMEPYLYAWSAYGAACKESCVCQGYANLFYRLATEAGLSTRIVTGTSFGEGHAWNIVEIDGYYYNIDATWDAGEVSYVYFLKGNDTFPDHIRDYDYTTDAFTGRYVMADTDYAADKKITGISLNQNAIEIKEGSSAKLTVTYYPNNASIKALTWTSSDPAIATVSSNGTVTAGNKTGTVTITATTTDGSDKSATCTVTVEHNYVTSVVSPSYTEQGYTLHRCNNCGHEYHDNYTDRWQYVTAISISDTSKQLECGDMFRLSASVAPANAHEKKLIWYSTDSRKASVAQDGLVTAIDPGTVDIVVLAADGSGISTRCTLTITEIENGWSNRSDGWYYVEDGVRQTGWQKIGSAWYYFDTKGLMQTGWVLDGGTWYYLNPNGDMATGWVYDGGSWYYLTGSGAMATGWVYDGSWYYLMGSGAMATGWIYDGGSWYYLTGSGAMATGWVYTGGTWYYMKPSGAMVTGRQYIGRRYYYFATNGAWIR
ncbi:MAG: Ig-like domain-containing protein [Lachnospiraceae bacterium]|nr:Ig-like domain-containing protein [Lachnospiraceae bacterium]